MWLLDVKLRCFVTLQFFLEKDFTSFKSSYLCTADTRFLHSFFHLFIFLFVFLLVTCSMYSVCENLVKPIKSIQKVRVAAVVGLDIILLLLQCVSHPEGGWKLSCTAAGDWTSSCRPRWWTGSSCQRWETYWWSKRWGYLTCSSKQLFRIQYIRYMQVWG